MGTKKLFIGEPFLTFRKKKKKRNSKYGKDKKSVQLVCVPMTACILDKMKYLKYTQSH